LSPAIYWRRRLLALAVLIALIWAGWQATGWIDRGDEPAPATTASPSDSPDPETPSMTDAESVAVSIPAAKGACDPENVRVAPSVKDGQHAGGAVSVDLLLSTVDGSGCVLDPNQADLLLVVSAGDADVYDSTGCQQSMLSESVAIPPGWAVQESVHWNGRRSGGSCGDGEELLGEGEYAAQIGTLGGEPGKTTFRLAPPKPPKKPDPEKPESEEPESEESAPAPESESEPPAAE